MTRGCERTAVTGSPGLCAPPPARQAQERGTPSCTVVGTASKRARRQQRAPVLMPARPRYAGPSRAPRAPDQARKPPHRRRCLLPSPHRGRGHHLHCHADPMPPPRLLGQPLPLGPQPRAAAAQALISAPRPGQEPADPRPACLRQSWQAPVLRGLDAPPKHLFIASATNEPLMSNEVKRAVNHAKPAYHPRC